MVRTSRAIRFAAAGVVLLFCASAAFGADLLPAGPPQGSPETAHERGGAAPSRHRDRKVDEARLDTVRIVGAAEHPAILFFLPRTKFRLLPLRQAPDPATRILRDEKRWAEPPGS